MAHKITATRVDDVANHAGTPGAFDIGTRGYGGKAEGMGFICPCGCGRKGWLPFKPTPSPSWQWDGDEAAPTLTPSVQQVGGCKWHGWLCNGEWVWA